MSRIRKGSGTAAKPKANITIYLLLSLLLITGLVFTLTESARIHSINTRLKGLTFMAADSCFAQFSPELFERYGIMALYRSEAEFTADFDSYLQDNLSLTGLDLYRDADLFLMHHQASAVESVEWLTDDNGTVFIRQVCDYMEYYLVKEVLEELMSMLGIMEEGDKIAAFVDKINSYKDVFLSVADSVASIQNHVDRARSVVNNPKTLLGEMNTCMEQYAQTGNQNNVAIFFVDYLNLGSGRDEMLRHMQGIQEDSETFAVSAAQAQEAVESLRQELEETGEAYSGETLEAIRAQIDTLEQKTADPSGDFYRLQENAEAAAEYADKLSSLDPLLSDIDLQQLLDDFLGYQSEVSWYNAAFSDFDLDRLGLSNTSERVKKESGGFLSTVKDIFTKGLMKAIVGDDISDRKTDTGNFPSVTVNRKRTGSEKESFATVPYRRLILAEYIKSHFGNYLEPVEDTELAYEAEYILAGKSSDKENLKTAIREIVLLRAGLNMVSLMRDSEKMAEAELMAQSIIGFTGMEVLVEALKMLIISVWCMAESLCDAKALAAGGKIALIKESWQWTVSATGLKNFSKTVLPAATDDNGLDYTDYLGILLLCKSNSTLAYRSMDLIQANACRWYRPDFRIASCINGIRMQSAFDAKALFSSFLFVRKMTGSWAGAYAFTVEQSYTYTGD